MRQPRLSTPRIALFKGLPAIAAATLCAAGAHAQTLRVRTAASTLPMANLHSYVSGEIGEDVVFLTGISGQGMHILSQGAGAVAFPLPNFADRVHLVDQTTGTLYSGTVAHLSPALQERLRVTNAAFVQYGDTLYAYGGYGPLNSGDRWRTHASVVAVDLQAVRAALRAGQPVPESAFNVLPSAVAQVAGGTIVKMGPQFALIGGSNFTGDYGLGEQQIEPFRNVYSDAVHLFDVPGSFTTPVQTFIDQFWLHRRDMNALPLTLPAQGGGTRSGFTQFSGVFNGPGPWENPTIFGAGDAAVTVFDTYVQKMNQYEAPHLSLWSPSRNENRLVILGGLSYQVFINGEFFYDFLVPWVTDVTDTIVRNGAFVDGSETVIGQTALPTTNAKLVLRPNIPVNANGQVLLDQLPHSEHLVGRIFGGLSAENPGGEPVTFASANVWNVFLAVGVRGDVNKDGIVNFADLNTILSQFGLSGQLAGDLNLDNIVNFADLNTVLSNFGSSTPG